MGFSARQYRAIQHCAKRYDRRMALCSFPFAFFVDKETGKETKVHINEVLNIYDTDRREDAEERARLKRLQLRENL